MYLPIKHPLRCLHRRYVSSKVIAEQSQTIRSRYKWYHYAFAGLSVSALGLWIWNVYGSQRTILRPLSASYFTKTTLTASEKANGNGKIIRLSLPPELLAGMANFQPIWSIYVKDSDIQIERPFTPLEGISTSGEMMFWIKKYPQGEMGRWLHSRSLGEKIEIRGPAQTWYWRDGEWDNIIMLLHAHFARESRQVMTPKFTLLQSYHSPKELLVADMQRKLALWSRDNPARLEIQTFVDNLGEAENEKGLKVGRISAKDIKEVLQASTGRTIVLVCGPEPMVNALAGPKGRDRSQGPVGGVLGEMNHGKFDVWKL